MKMGTTRSPYRYDAAVPFMRRRPRDATESCRLRYRRSRRRIPDADRNNLPRLGPLGAFDDRAVHAHRRCAGHEPLDVGHVLGVGGENRAIVLVGGEALEVDEP